MAHKTGSVFMANMPLDWDITPRNKRLAKKGTLVNIAQEDLNAWARTLFAVNGLLLSSVDAAINNDPTSAGRHAERARCYLDGLYETLVHIGAEDPRAAAMDEMGIWSDRCLTHGLEPEDTSLDIINSPTTRNYARVMRIAAELAIQIDKERGWYPEGPSTVVCSWADAAEFDAFGPRDLVDQ